MHLGEGDAGVVVDGHEQHLPAESADMVTRVTGDAVAQPLDAAELLGVDVQQVARSGVLVALHGLDRLQVGQLREACPAQYAAHSGLGHSQAGGDARLGQAPAAQFDDGQRLGFADTSGAVPRTGTGIGQRRLTANQVPTQPLAGGRLAHASRCRGLGWRKPVVGHQAHHLESTGEGQSGILVVVHSAGVP